MKRITLCVMFSAEAILCAILVSLMRSGDSLSAGVMAFPFAQIGDGLRVLSLSGDIGNIAAVLIYCIVCLMPAVYLCIRVFRAKARAEDGLLALLSIVLFAVLYMMINPADIARHFGSAELVSGSKVMLGATVYATMAGYIILRALRAFTQSGTASMLRHLQILLYVLCALLVYAVSGAGTIRLMGALEQLKIGNTGDGNLTLSCIFIVLQFIVDSLPYVLNIIIIFSGFGFIEALEDGLYGDKVVPMARETARLCRIAVISIMLSQIAVNTLQFALGSLVRSSSYTLSIPLLPVVFVLAAMLLAHYFEQARALKDDNDMII